MSIPKHCPGFEANKNLTSFWCSCPECGHEIEIFSDEFDRTHKCKQCGVQIDFTRCKIDAAAHQQK